jgi:hypothetical protein
VRSFRLWVVCVVDVVDVIGKMCGGKTKKAVRACAPTALRVTLACLLSGQAHNPSGWCGGVLLHTLTCSGCCGGHKEGPVAVPTCDGYARARSISRDG